ncbi:hypothetical protein LINPERPRIM_LOCUS32813 [Linum perenne]
MNNGRQKLKTPCRKRGAAAMMDTPLESKEEEEEEEEWRKRERMEKNDFLFN